MRNSNEKAAELAEFYKQDANMPAFFNDCLVIKPEKGGLIPLTLNDVQIKVHNRLQDQLARTGKVRAIVLKPRRQGLSTYINARFYHRTIYNFGVETRITTHLAAATTTLFKMVKAYQKYMPPELRPSAGEDNQNKLTFPNSESGYSLGTANSKDDGRSGLAHFLHCSEVAYWENAEDVAAANFEMVGNEPGTEIILESTGKSGTLLEDLWRANQSPSATYDTIFIPWYECARNRVPAGGIEELTKLEKELMAAFPKMTLENIAFRRMKLEESGGKVAKFLTEYPATPAEAFSRDAKEAFIPPAFVLRAVNRKPLKTPNAPVVMGVDASNTENGDAGAIMVRQGTEITRVAEFRREDVFERAKVVYNAIKHHDPKKVFIDQGGSGKEIRDVLVKWGLPRKLVIVVPFGMKATYSKLYPNKRVEMYSEARDWLRDEGSIPKNQQLMAELSYTKGEINVSGQEVLESKKKMSKSPNLSDAFALTFAFPVK